VLLTESLSEAFTDEVATAFLGAIADELAPTGLALALLTASDRDDVVPARDLALDGAVLYSCLPESEARTWLIRRRLPLVTVDQDPIPGVPSVNVDDRAGARAAAEHVVELGHRRVGLLLRSLDGSIGVVDRLETSVKGHPQRQRLLGWLDALQAAGIRPVAANTPDNSSEACRTAARELLTIPQRPTAVLSFSDVSAFGVLAAARELGLAVPGDLSVVGFDDSPASRISVPPLTSIRQDLRAKGREAAKALTTEIAKSRSAATRSRAPRVVLPTELVVRQSTGPANG
jgi:DNA-binding LacI/PurR family transcriptional regulator